MKVNQVSEFLNSLMKQTTGQTDIVNTDLSNVVDAGNAIFDVMSVDNYLKKAIDHVGRVEVVNRRLDVSAPSLIMDSWEYGAALEKITIAMPEAENNQTWQLTDGQTYNQDTFYTPDVTIKFYQQRDTYSILMSRAERQIRSAFSSPEQLMAFFAGLETQIRNAMTLNTDNLIRSTLNTMFGVTLNDEFSNGTYTGVTSVKAVNLLHEFNTINTSSITAAQAMTDPDFLRFASNRMRNYINWLSSATSLMNVGNTVKFTPRDDLHVVLLSEFYNAANTYLQSDTFHNEFTSLPLGEIVPYWQGSGLGFSFEDTSSIDIKIPNSGGSGTTTITASGILGCMFDRWCMGVNNQNFRAPTHINAAGEFVNTFYKYDGGFFYDSNENFVMFYVA